MDYSISIADLEKEGDDVKGFWGENFPGWPQDKYSMFYMNNPCGQATCWIVREPEENKLIGANAIVPRGLYIKGNYETEAIVIDFGVNIKHRGLGSAQMLQNSLVEYHNDSDIGFLYATPNVVSEKVLRRADFDIIGKYQRMVKILDSKRYIKRIVKLEPISKLFSWPVNAILYNMSQEKRYRRNDEFRIESPDHFDDRFDVLWNEAMPNYSMIGERTSKFLNWRFADCPYLDYKIFVIIQKDMDKILGYVVYQVIKDNVYIEDIFALDIKDSLDILISEFSLFNRERNMETISFGFFGSNEVVELFKTHNYISRKDYHAMAVRINSKCPYASEIRDKNNWYFLNGDNDGAFETERYSG